MGCSGGGDNNNNKNGFSANNANGDTMNLFDDSSQKQKQHQEHRQSIKDSCCYDTSSDTSSVCSSVKSCRSLLLSSSFNMSESSLSISSINKKTNKKKKVRFNNNNKLFTSKKRVQCSVRTFERAPREDRDMLWWTGAELLARKKADAELAKQNAEAAMYLSDSFQVLLRVTDDDAAISSSPSRNRPPLPSSLERIVAGLDEGYRGLERKHGSAGVDRQFHCEQTVKDVCLFARKKARNDDEGALLRYNDKQGCGDEENATKGIVTDTIDDAEDERIRRFSRRLTERSQRLAAFYGKVDAIVGCRRKP